MQIQELEKSIEKKRKEKRFLGNILREVRFIKEKNEHSLDEETLDALESELEDL